MKISLHTPLVRFLSVLTLVGCTGQPPPEPYAPPRTAPPPDVSMEVNAYIADVRSLIADMEKVQDEGDSLPDVRSLKDNQIFQETMRTLNGFFLEAMKSRNMQLYIDNVRVLEERIQREGDRKLSSFVKGVIGYHARLMHVTTRIAEISKKIDAMEPRLHDLKNKLILAVAQNPAGYNYTALVAILNNEQTRFVRKIDEWTAHMTQKN